jgi:hypothetical protein
MMMKWLTVAQNGFQPFLHLKRHGKKCTDNLLVSSQLVAASNLPHYI